MSKEGIMGSACVWALGWDTIDRATADAHKALRYLGLELRREV